MWDRTHPVRGGTQKMWRHTQEMRGRTQAKVGSHPRRVESHPRNVESHPRNEGTHPRNVESQPRNVGSHPTNEGTHPRNDGSHPTNDGSHPRNDGGKPVPRRASSYRGSPRSPAFAEVAERRRPAGWPGGVSPPSPYHFPSPLRGEGRGERRRADCLLRRRASTLSDIACLAVACIQPTGARNHSHG